MKREFYNSFSGGHLRNFSRSPFIGGTSFAQSLGGKVKRQKNIRAIVLDYAEGKRIYS